MFKVLAALRNGVPFVRSDCAGWVLAYEGKAFLHGANSRDQDDCSPPFYRMNKDQVPEILGFCREFNNRHGSFGMQLF